MFPPQFYVGPSSLSGLKIHSLGRPPRTIRFLVLGPALYQLRVHNQRKSAFINERVASNCKFVYPVKLNPILLLANLLQPQYISEVRQFRQIQELFDIDSAQQSALNEVLVLDSTIKKLKGVTKQAAFGSATMYQLDKEKLIQSLVVLYQKAKQFFLKNAQVVFCNEVVTQENIKMLSVQFLLQYLPRPIANDFLLAAGITKPLEYCLSYGSPSSKGTIESHFTKRSKTQEQFRGKQVIDQLSPPKKKQKPKEAPKMEKNQSKLSFQAKSK